MTLRGSRMSSHKKIEGTPVNLSKETNQSIMNTFLFALIKREGGAIELTEEEFKSALQCAIRIEFNKNKGTVRLVSATIKEALEHQAELKAQNETRH